MQFLQNITKEIPKERIVLSSSCSLLHLPFSKEKESKMDTEILSWLCFAKDKIDELKLLDSVFRNGITAENQALWEQNIHINTTRKNAAKIHNKSVQKRLKESYPTERTPSFNARIKIQRDALNYPILATTTIGSFPQTPELRALRRDFKQNAITKDAYENGIKAYIKDCIHFQEEIGLDVLVHGEPERNDMVEYFGEQLSGFVFSQNAWGAKLWK